MTQKYQITNIYPIANSYTRLNNLAWSHTVASSCSSVSLESVGLLIFCYFPDLNPLINLTQKSVLQKKIKKMRRYNHNFLIPSYQKIGDLMFPIRNSILTALPQHQHNTSTSTTGSILQ